MMGWSPQCYIPSFVKIGLPVLEKIFEGFLPYMGVAANLALIGLQVPEKIFKGFSPNMVVAAILVM